MRINPFTSKLPYKVYNKFLYSLPNYYKKFYSNIKYPEPNGKKILIYSAIGDMYLSPLEILMYHLLKSKGVEVHYYVYNSDIPLMELTTKKVVDGSGAKSLLSQIVSNTEKNLKAANVLYHFIEISPEIDSIISKLESIEEIFHFKFEGVDFGHIVKGVMYRYYNSLTFGDDSFEVAKKFLKTSLSNYLQVKKLNEKFHYDYLLFSHGIYCTWEPVLNYAINHNVDFVCYDRAKVKGTCNFNLNVPSPVWDISSVWERLSEYRLNTNELEQVDRYLKERELQKGDVYAYNFSEKEKDISRLREKYHIAPKAKIITFFTNLIWDAANVSRDIAFNSPLECIKKTIDYYENKEGVHLLLRSHPAEKIIGSKERYGQLIRDSYQQLPKNVSIIEPEDNINSFSVLELSDIGVVHTSTVGLEMAIEGKPVILISETHYRNKGFTHDATDEADFFMLLEKLLNESQSLPNQIELAKKYFYLMMFKYQHRMPMKMDMNNIFNGYGPKHFNQILSSKEGDIHRIIERIVSEEEFQDFVFK